MKAWARIHDDTDDADEASKAEGASISTYALMQQTIYAGLGIFGWLALTENRSDGDNVSDTTHTLKSTAVRNCIVVSIYLRVFIGGPLLVYQAHALLERKHREQVARTAAISTQDVAPYTGSTSTGSGGVHSACCQTFMVRFLMLGQASYGLCDILQAYISDYEGPVETNSLGESTTDTTTGLVGHGEAHKNFAQCMVALMLMNHALFLYLLISTGNGVRITCNGSDHPGGMVWACARQLSHSLGVLGIFASLVYSIYVSLWLSANFWDIGWLNMEWKLPTSLGLLYVFTSLTFR
jgi:hypothetical protein